MNETLREIVAIDGPAGAGKSTIARRIADALGFAYLDTGAMYRAATWWAQSQGVAMDDASGLADATRGMQLELDLSAKPIRVRVAGQDISEAIRTPEVTRAIRNLDRLAEVRAILVEQQRAFAAQQPTVAEGRDMGTVVFPEARCKIYLDASLDERARRRADEMASKGMEVAFDVLRKDIAERDESDRTRAVAPLRKADDAVAVDTTDKSIESVVEEIMNLARERLCKS